MKSLTGHTLPVSGGINVLVHGLLHVANSDVKLAHLLSEGGPSRQWVQPGRRRCRDSVGSTGRDGHSPLPALAQAELLAPCWYMGWSQPGAYLGVTLGMYSVKVHVPDGGVVGWGYGWGDGYGDNCGGECCALVALLDALLVTLSPETLERWGSSRGTVSGPWSYNLKSELGNRIWFCMARVKENQRIIQTLLNNMPLSQISLIDRSPGINNGWHIGP
jgi:hypothetical protein